MRDALRVGSWQKLHKWRRTFLKKILVTRVGLRRSGAAEKLSKPTVPSPPTYFPTMKTHTILALAALSAPAFGATIVQTQNFSFVPDGSAVLTFDQFDTLGGLRDLDLVTISITLTKLDGALFVDNDSVNPASGNITQTVTISLSAAFGIVDNSFQPIGSGVQAVSTYFADLGGDDGDTDTIVGNNDGFQNDGGVDVDGTNFGPETTTVGATTVNSATYGNYIGTGTFDITINGLQGTSTASVGGAAFSGEPATATGSVTITYVPEPSIAILGGLGILGILRRRRTV
jgi:hypothetical protein